jgi:hypothetical protein
MLHHPENRRENQPAHVLCVWQHCLPPAAVKQAQGSRCAAAAAAHLLLQPAQHVSRQNPTEQRQQEGLHLEAADHGVCSQARHTQQAAGAFCQRLAACGVVRGAPAQLGYTAREKQDGQAS